MGCLFFLVCLKTYEESSTRITILREMGIIEEYEDNFTDHVIPRFEKTYFQDHYDTAIEATTYCYCSDRVDKDKLSETWEAI